MNIFWPVFKNLEFEFSKLMYDIHIDDSQLSVYSLKIADLILRSAIEIESISKELYFANGGTKSGHIRYDDDAIKLLNKKWLLDKKVVLISSNNCFLTKKELYPFVKNEIIIGKTTKTFSWNNSYQNIKHDRAKSLKFGSIKYLFDSMAALYVLNLYFSDRNFKLEKDSKGVSLSPNLGSDIFSIVIYPYKGKRHDGNRGYLKGDEFEKCIYYIDRTEDTAKVFDDSMDLFQQKINELAMKSPKTLEYLSKVNTKNLKPNWLWDALGQDAYVNILRQAQRVAPIATEQLRYWAILNKNQI